jgi:histidinol phosphatase-like PHP family hydrolase
MDLHSHSNFSSCGRDEAFLVVEKAIESGIELLGITDHNDGIGDRKKAYSELIGELKEKYSDKITLLCGIEVSLLEDKYDMSEETYKLFDFCLLESLGHELSVARKDIFEFLKSIKIKKGIAHTDLFDLADKLDISHDEFFNKFAETGTFWEMNVNYDSIHGYREHAYVKRFFESQYEQGIIRDSKVFVSIGFDGHNISDYLGDRVIEANKKLEKTGVNMADSLFERRKI